MKKLSLNIKIVIRPDKQRKNGDYPLYYSVRIQGATNRVATGKYIRASDWDIKNGCLKTNTKANQLLSKLLTDNMNSWWETMYQLEADGKPVTLQVATAFLKDEAKQTFYEFFEDEINIWAIEDKVENTIKSYRSTLNVLREFAPKATFGDLTYSFIQQFDLHMSQKRGNTVNGRWGRHKCLRAVIREAIKKGLMKEGSNPYKFFSIKSTESKRQPLTIAEINEIKALEIPEKNGFLNRVKDLFLLSAFTGLRYSDLMRLSFDHLKSDPDMIVMVMQKTQKEVTIPLLPDAKLILEKYTKHKIKTPGLTIMPQMTNQVLNRELKVLIGKTGITKHVTCHTARHAFATTLVQSNVNLIEIRDLLGHKSVTQSQTYAKSVQSELINTMEKLALKYGQAI